MPTRKRPALLANRPAPNWQLILDAASALTTSRQPRLPGSAGTSGPGGGTPAASPTGLPNLVERH
jgi:hypothetical protein